jgi:hypothetical protein
MESVNISVRSNDVPLTDVLKEVRERKIQLPDFQRSWVWDDDHIKGLLTSISLSYPIGAIMLLKSGNPDINFKARTIEGLSNDNLPNPEHLILDGQQRLTALIQTLSQDRPVDTQTAQKKPIKRWYYIDIMKAMNAEIDREDAIFGLPEDRLVKNFRGETIADFSSPEKEYASCIFPFSRLLDFSSWRRGFNGYWKHDSQKSELIDDFEEKIVKKYTNYLIPVITLQKETPKEAVCQIFEKVNTGGVSLTIFELMTATFAADDFRLREDWEKKKQVFSQHEVIKKIENTDFLQAISLTNTGERRKKDLQNGVSLDKAHPVGCKRTDILKKMVLADFQRWEGPVAEGYVKAAKLLNIQKFFSFRDLPYRTQITPLAAVLAVIGNDADRGAVRDKLFRWYWCGVLGELYGSAIESRFARDFMELQEWIRDGPEPSTIRDANFVPDRLVTLRTRNSAAYKGIATLLLRENALDFISGEPIDITSYFFEKIDIHHIFPEEWCKRQGISSDLYNSIINKTPLSARTNRIIQGHAPSKYLERIQKHAGYDTPKMDEVLRSHVIDPNLLRSDDFTGFFEARKEAILTRIELAMGKPVAREVTEYIENGAI